MPAFRGHVGGLGGAAADDRRCAKHNCAPPATSAAQQTSSKDQTENTGDDFVRPLNLFQLMYQYKTAPGSGAERGTTTAATTDTINLRMDHRIDLSPQWALGLRADLPFLTKNPISSDNPDGDYLHDVGDADIQAALIDKLDERWTVGLGARLFAPTGGDTLGTGKWRIMPGMAVRYALSEISPSSYLEPLVRYDVSFAGDPSKKNISSLQFAPTFNLGLPDRWFVTFYPSADIRGVHLEQGKLSPSFPDRQIQLPARLIYLPVLSSREFSSQPIVIAARSSTESRLKHRFLRNSL